MEVSCRTNLLGVVTSLSCSNCLPILVDKDCEVVPERLKKQEGPHVLACWSTPEASFHPYMNFGFKQHLLPQD